MLRKATALRALSILVLSALSIRAQEIEAPPTPPPTIENASTEAAASGDLKASALSLFSIGNPTDEEQLYLEMLNRSRKDPVTEAERMLASSDPTIKLALIQFNVDTNLMKAQFATNPPVPPLSFNSKLITAARGHTQYQFDNGIQTHDGPGTNTLRERLQAVGYSIAAAGENVFVYANTVEHGHAGFDIDWGVVRDSQGNIINTGGMQSPPGHRNTIHNGRFTEVGIGVINGTNKVGSNAQVGPQLVTQDFGVPPVRVVYITGVAYYDLNGNNFYDVGEGLSGVTVTVDGVNSYAVTSASGGYSVPIAPNNSYTVRFNAANASEAFTAVNISTNNVKVDYKPVYNAPSIASGPVVPFAGVTNTYHISVVGGRTAYNARTFTLRAPAAEGAEGLLTNVTLFTSSGYAPVTTTIKASGTKAFHLTHRPDSTTGKVLPQLIQFTRPLYVNAGARVDFKSRLGIAFGGDPQSGPEIALVEVSTDEGKTWTSIWSQAGTQADGQPDSSEQTFNARTASLAAYVNKFILLRFNYNFDRSYYPLSDDPFGWYIDDIVLTAVDEAATPTVTTLTDEAFQFSPATAGRYGLQFQAVAGSRSFPWGPFSPITVQADAPAYSFLNNLGVTNGVVSMRFSQSSGATIAVSVESAPTPAGPWTIDTSATITGPSRGIYTVSIPASGDSRFYRVRTN